MGVEAGQVGEEAGAEGRDVDFDISFFWGGGRRWGFRGVVVVVSFSAELLGTLFVVGAVKDDFAVGVDGKVVEEEAFSTTFVEVCRGLFEEGVDGELELELFDGEGGEVFCEGGFGGALCLWLLVLRSEKSGGGSDTQRTVG